MRPFRSVLILALAAPMAAPVVEAQPRNRPEGAPAAGREVTLADAPKT